MKKRKKPTLPDVAAEEPEDPAGPPLNFSEEEKEQLFALAAAHQAPTARLPSLVALAMGWQTPFDDPTAKFMTLRMLLTALEAHARLGSDIPEPFLGELTFALRELLEGRRPSLLQPVDPSGGRPSARILEEDCVNVAVSYRLAVDRKYFPDRRPIQTILDAFSGAPPKLTRMDKTTIQRWVRERRGTVTPLAINDAAEARLLLAIAGKAYVNLKKGRF